MSRALHEAFENCWQEMQNGVEMDACLSAYPLLAAQLKPLLESARHLGNATQPPLAAGALQRNKQHILAYASQLGSSSPKASLPGRTLRRAIIVIAILIFMVFSGNNLVGVSARALPGESLYPLKRSVEHVQLKFTSNQDQRILLEDEFSHRRLDETETLLTSGRIARVEFDGIVQQELPSGWLVNGIPVVVTGDTLLGFTITVGSGVEVVGQTQLDGSVIAERIDPHAEEVETGELSEEGDNH